MKGYLWTSELSSSKSEPSSTTGHLTRWESIATDAVGNVIEFWGFKRNQGRVWALLFLRGEAMSAGKIERELGLSKGGVSMLLRDLERWGVVMRVRSPGDASWRYEAETDLVKMVIRVVEEREAGFISRIRADIEEAIRLASRDPNVGKESLERLKRMSTLADRTEKALRVFVKTARLDVGGMLETFRELRPSSRRGGH